MNKFKSGTAAMDLMKTFISIVVGAITVWAITTATLKAHMDNNYVHNDIQSLGATFVRKDVQAAEWRGINEKLDRISKEMGIVPQ